MPIFHQELNVFSIRRSGISHIAEQQERLSELMNLWRSARDQGQALPPEQQAELDSLVEMELRAATARACIT